MMTKEAKDSSPPLTLTKRKIDNLTAEQPGSEGRLMLKNVI